MNKVILNALVFSTSLLFFGTSAYAQGQEGHGGSIYSCADGKNYLIDLEEVKQLAKLNANMKIVYSDEDVDTQVRRALKRLESMDPEVYLSAMKRYERLKGIFSSLRTTNRWSVPQDLGMVPEKEGCELKNIINYMDDYHIEVNEDLYQALSSKTDQAALFTHEVLYAMTREKKRSAQSTSLAARRITAYLHSDLDRPDLLNGLVQGYLSTRRKDTQMIFLSKPSGSTLELNYDLRISLENVDNYTSVLTLDGKEIANVQSPLHVNLSAQVGLSEASHVLEITAYFLGTPYHAYAKASLVIEGEEVSIADRELNENTVRKIRIHRYVESIARVITIPATVRDYLFGNL